MYAHACLTVPPPPLCGAVFTDPVIQSQDGRYGPTDLGHAGISSFFFRHQCNQFCKAEWTRPRVEVAYYNAEQSTSMITGQQRIGAPGGGQQFAMLPPAPRRTGSLPTWHE